MRRRKRRGEYIPSGVTVSFASSLCSSAVAAPVRSVSGGSANVTVCRFFPLASVCFEVPSPGSSTPSGSPVRPTDCLLDGPAVGVAAVARSGVRSRSGSIGGFSCISWQTEQIQRRSSMYHFSERSDRQTEHFCTFGGIFWGRLVKPTRALPTPLPHSLLPSGVPGSPNYPSRSVQERFSTMKFSS
uniref:Putative secreted protein n=1 Tax=Anopheles marajoara TaxID=58244 RepID=A0A2M4C5U5_9DIPT